MDVFLTGGTGYVGRAVLSRLCEGGHRVSVLQRPGSTRALRNVPDQVRIVEGDLLDRRALEQGMSGSDAVVHLVGIIREILRIGVTMQRVHVEGTQSVVAAAKQAKVRRFIYVSALGARPHAVSSYHRSKWDAEELVRTSGIPYVIFRPSVIFGRGGPGPEFVGQLTDLMRKAPLVPVIGHGRYLLQPVALDTVAEAVVRGLESDRAVNRVYEAGGPEVLTYEDILREIASALHKPFRPVRLPENWMTLLVPVLQNIPGFPITKDQLTMLLEGNVCNDSESLYRDLGLEKIQFRVDVLR